MVTVVSRSQTLSSTRDYSYGGCRGDSYIDRRTVEDGGGGSFCPFTIIHGLSMLSRISTIAFRGYCVSRRKQIYIATRGNENSAVTRIATATVPRSIDTLTEAKRTSIAIYIIRQRLRSGMPQVF